MKTKCFALCLLFVGMITAVANKTDLAREVFVAESETDFAVTVKRSVGDKPDLHIFEISAARAGVHTLICFIDGVFWSMREVNLPAKYSLSVRGLAPGDHKLTLQLVGKDGKVGSVKQTISKPKAP